MVKDFLYSDKKIFDPVYGFIPFDEFEKELIDSIPFQRLHYIHQLEMSYLVYPGANHTRFEHSVGTMELVTQIFENICKSVRPDVFHFVPRKGSSDYLYWRRVLRMAALCHDLGRYPFSYATEQHENWTLQIIDSPHLQNVWNKLKNAPAYLEDLIERDIVADIKKIAIGEYHWKRLQLGEFSPWERIVSDILNGEFLGADRIDSLLRDAKSTGITYGLFDYRQLIDTLRVLPSVDHGADEMQIGIDENGLESCEALLLARHFMCRRIYHYSSVKAYNFHLRRYMAENCSFFQSVEDFLALSDSDVICALNRAARDPKMKGHADAKCVCFRQHRFRAIDLPEGMMEKDIIDFKNSHQIPDRDLVMEFHKESHLAEKLNFPVSKRHVVIQKARDCSELMLKVSELKTNWVYVSPDYDLALINFLEPWNN